MDYQHTRYEQDGPVTIITINRPERMNAIGPQTHRELVDAWDRFRADDDAFVSARQENLETIHQHNVTAERFGLLGEMRAELRSGDHSQHHVSMREWLDGRA